MVELGLGVVVACLPTLRTLLGSFSPDAIISNFRSVFSLHSLKSGGSHSSLRLHNLDQTSAHRAGLSRQAGSTDTSLATANQAVDLEKQAEMPNGKILVETNISHSERRLQ